MGDNRRAAVQGNVHGPPSAAATVRRERLHSALDRAFERTGGPPQEPSVVWLEGPPGSGKTRLAAGYLQSHPHPCRWVPADPHTWKADLDAAFGQQTNNMLTVVIDDLQRIVPKAIATLFKKINSAPPGVRFLLISRAAPPKSVAKMPVKMAVIGWSQLQLTLPESTQIATTAGRSDLSAPTLARMHAASGGWVAGFSWMLARIQPEGRCTMAVRRALADYFSAMGELPEPLENRHPDDIWGDQWPVRVRTLGPFEVTTQSGSLTHARKTKKKPLELLKLLICAGEQGLPEARVIDTLWPDAEGDAGLRVLATTLHRLRVLIRCDACITRKHGWLRLNPDRVWVDAWAFERRLNDANITADPIRMESTIGLYEGPFLAATGDPSWVLDTRSRLRGLYVRHLMHLSEAYAARGDWTQVEAINRQGLAADHLAEPFHQGLMTACLEQGRRTEAASAYQRCRTALDEALGLAPAPATEAIYARIQNG